MEHSWRDGDNYLPGDSNTNSLAEAVKRKNDLLKEALLQIEYLHGKFMTTGTGNSVISRIKTEIQR